MHSLSLQVTVRLKLDQTRVSSHTLRNYYKAWSNLGLCAPWAQIWEGCGLAKVVIKSFSRQVSQRPKAHPLTWRKDAAQSLHSLVERVLTFESWLGIEPSSITDLAGCSFGELSISVSPWIFNFRIILNLFWVDTIFFKECKNTSTYLALTLHQALIDTFSLFIHKKPKFIELSHGYPARTRRARIQTQDFLTQKSLLLFPFIKLKRCSRIMHLKHFEGEKIKFSTTRDNCYFVDEETTVAQNSAVTSIRS